MDPDTARQGWRALEPYHAMVYFTAEPQAEYAALGLDVAGNRAAGYFPPRAAAMGRVGAAVVHATFFNFSRPAVDRGMAGVWDVTTPQELLAARLRGADRALRRLCGDLLDDPAVAEAAGLARAATAGCTAGGRPVYAAHADLAWPQAPHLALWHGVTLLREFRGDGHVATLAREGLDGLQAAVLHVASGQSWSRAGLQTTRGYTDEQWQGAIDTLAARGWLTSDGAFTAEGRAHRQTVEDETDRLALRPWAVLGERDAGRLLDLVRPLSQAVLDGGGIGIR